jgi:hypothetical protein
LYIIRLLLRNTTNLKSVTRKNTKRFKTKEEDELANHFNDTMKISKRRRVDDV